MKNWNLFICLCALALCLVSPLAGADEPSEAAPAAMPSEEPYQLLVSVFNPSTIHSGRLSWLESELDIVAPQSWSKVINLADHGLSPNFISAQLKLYLLEPSGIPVYPVTPLTASLDTFSSHSADVLKLEPSLPEGITLPEQIRTAEKLSRQRALIRNRDLYFAFRISYGGKEIALIPPLGLREVSFPTIEGHCPLHAVALNTAAPGLEVGHDRRIFEMNVCGAFLDSRVEWTLPDMGDLVKCKLVCDTTYGSEVKIVNTDPTAPARLEIQNLTDEFVRVIGFGRELLFLPPHTQSAYTLALRGTKPDALRLSAYAFPAGDPNQSFPLYSVELESDWSSLTWKIRNPLKAPARPRAAPALVAPAPAGN